MYAQLDPMKNIAKELKKDRDSAGKKIAGIEKEIQALIQKLRTTDMSQKDIDKALSELVKNMDKQLGDLKKLLEKQKSDQEQERLRKIQDEMEKEKRKREEEERKKAEEERQRKLKQEMEVKRKEEEKQRKKQEESDRKQQAAMLKELEKESAADAQRSHLMEQERRDRELALRLASEDASQVEDLSQAPMRPLQRQGSKSKFDLSKWTYAELRDTINTSCDLELLESCREEFHRRLKVYHAWKSKHKKRVQSQDDERAPKNIMQNGPSMTGMGKSSKTEKEAAQRYFRIPFVRPSDQHRDEEYKKKGWWFAHFDGKWIARQMEIHPDKQTLLLTAGVDDMQMCELSLEETGLTRKRGAEILDVDFEQEWEKHGGRDVLERWKHKLSSDYLQRRLGVKK